MSFGNLPASLLGVADATRHRNDAHHSRRHRPQDSPIDALPPSDCGRQEVEMTTRTSYRTGKIRIGQLNHPRVHVAVLPLTFVMLTLFSTENVYAQIRFDKNLLKRDDAWFRSEAARAVADSVIQYQSPQGGWPKSADLARPPRSPDDIPPPGGGRANSLDNDATTVPMQFLARIAHETGDKGGPFNDRTRDPRGDYDYDLYKRRLLIPAQERHGVVGVPKYSPNANSGQDELVLSLEYTPAPDSPAVDAGQRLPNFNDDFTGKSPDLGAIER